MNNRALAVQTVHRVRETGSKSILILRHTGNFEEKWCAVFYHAYLNSYSPTPPRPKPQLAQRPAIHHISTGFQIAARCPFSTGTCAVVTG
jgi:hypothetical protein